MLQLRPYQSDSITELREGFKNHQRQILCLPTGAGKTVIFSSIVAAAALKGRTVLILTHRAELFSQTLKAINKHDFPVCRIDKTNKVIFGESKIFLAMIETFKRRIKLFEHIKFDLIICDEAHRNDFFTVFEAFPSVKSLGCTATPSNTKLHKYYTNLIAPVDVPELIEMGFLSPLKSFMMTTDLSDLEKDKSGEFTEESNFKHFAKSKLFEGVIDEYVKKCNGKKTICFNCNVAHSDLMAKAFNAAGIRSYSVTSETPEKERKWIFEAFEKGEFLVLNNCGIATTGTDIPSVEVIILNRAIGVLSLYLQCVGRGGRLFPGKTFFTLLDFGMNIKRHGLWEQNRQWTLEPPKKKNKLGAAPLRCCTNCEAMLPAQQRLCNFCGFEITAKEAELLKGELVEVKSNINTHPKVSENLVGRKISDLSIQELIDLEPSKKYSIQFIWRLVRSKGESGIIEYANAKKYKAGWIHRAIETMAEELSTGGTTFKNITIKN